MGRGWATTYALVNCNGNEHGLKEQDLERHGKDVVEPTSDWQFTFFHRCIISTVPGLFPDPLGFSRKENRSISFGKSKEYRY